ncbi:recombinase zinc beta ribbon domain-containing protein [Polyangium fumosum]
MGTKARGPRARYLLSGIGRCAECGGPMRSDHGKVSYETVLMYSCSWHRDRGPAVCRNGLRRPIATVDASVIRWLQANVLQEDVILHALKTLRERLAERAKTTPSETPALEAEARKLREEIARLGEAIIATTDAPTTLVRMMAEREKRLTAIESRLAAIQTAPSVLDLEVRRMEKEARGRIADIAGLLERNPERARSALERLVTAPLRFVPIETPEGKRFWVEGSANLWALFAAGCLKSASPAGFETLRHPQNTAFPLDLPRVASARMGFAA